MVRMLRQLKLTSRSRACALKMNQRAPKSTKTVRWSDHVQPSTQSGGLSTSIIIESSWPATTITVLTSPPPSKPPNPYFASYSPKPRTRSCSTLVAMDGVSALTVGTWLWRGEGLMRLRAIMRIISCTVVRCGGKPDSETRIRANGLRSTTRRCTARDIIRILTQTHRMEEEEREFIDWLRGRAINSTR